MGTPFPIHSQLERGFTLVEVLMSIVIMMIGFVAVFGFVAVSDRAIQRSSAKFELNTVGNDIIESISADRANLSEYINKNLGNCSRLSASKGKKEQLKRLKKWCDQLKSVAGEAVSSDIRKIKVKNVKVGSKDVIVVTVELSSRGGKDTFFAKRVFNAP